MMSLEPPKRNRAPTTLTLAMETREYFADHPEYTPGRCLDLWVREQREKDAVNIEDQFAARIAALQVGPCKCGRITFPSRKLGRIVCPGCMGDPEACGCEPTLALRERYFLEWQASREKAGVLPAATEMEEKRLELRLGTVLRASKYAERMLTPDGAAKAEEERKATEEARLRMREQIEATARASEAGVVPIREPSIYQHPSITKARKGRR